MDRYGELTYCLMHFVRWMVAASCLTVHGYEVIVAELQVF